jgi:transposase-like protein
MVAAVIRTAIVQETSEEAVRQWRETADRPRERFPKLSELMNSDEEDVLGFMNFPKDHRKKIANTKPLETVNKEIKRRANVIGISPNDVAIMRLVGALFIKQTGSGI